MVRRDQGWRKLHVYTNTPFLFHVRLSYFRTRKVEYVMLYSREKPDFATSSLKRSVPSFSTSSLSLSTLIHVCVHAYVYTHNVCGKLAEFQEAAGVSNAQRKPSYERYRCIQIYTNIMLETREFALISRLLHCVTFSYFGLQSSTGMTRCVCIYVCTLNTLACQQSLM